MTYEEYQHLKFDLKPNGVLLITLNRPDVLNATNARLHWELTQIWKTVDDDPNVKVVLVTGAGKAFSAGGDLEMVENMAGNPTAIAQALREAGDIVYNMINLDKPIISAINGVAVGAGLAVALMADVRSPGASGRCDAKQPRALRGSRACTRPAAPSARCRATSCRGARACRDRSSPRAPFDRFRANGSTGLV